uniref:Putative secreted protein n=1 Tax=Anopheles darlingi TaxID=43151 RepID=A0A2M4DLB3_ANODA
MLLQPLQPWLLLASTDSVVHGESLSTFNGRFTHYLSFPPFMESYTWISSWHTTKHTHTHTLSFVRFTG